MQRPDPIAPDFWHVLNFCDPNSKAYSSRTDNLCVSAHDTSLFRKNSQKMGKLSTGGIEVLSLHLDGMPTDRMVDFPPMGVAGIVAWIDDKLKDGPERVFPAISDRRKDDELPSTPETIEAANLGRIVALGFFEGDRLLVEPTIHSDVVMTFNDETGEQVFLTVKITDILGRLRMGEDYRNIPPVESADGKDWWAELRRRYPKETFWVPRKYRHRNAGLSRSYSDRAEKEGETRSLRRS